MKKYCLLLHNRNKVRYVADAIRSMFAQVGPPIELLLSDNGSDDGSKEVMNDLASRYDGPHKVRRIDCPYNGMPGMAGLNFHINWCMTQTDADVVMTLSGDDYDLAQRSEMTIAAFEEFNPSMVLGSMYYVNENMVYQGQTPDLEEGKPGMDGWASIESIFGRFIGGSTIQAWDRPFWDRVGPLEGVGSPDVVLPFLAVLDRGAYFLHTPIHAYRKVLGENNTGLEGILFSYPEGDERRIPIEEQIHFQVSAGLYTALRKMNDAGMSTEAAQRALLEAAIDRNASWVHVREKMSLMGIAPLKFRV